MAANASEIHFKKLHPNAKIPVRATEDSAALDLIPIEDGWLEPHSSAKFRTGLAWEVPPGTVGLIKPRSSIFGMGLDLDGVVDADYRGDITLQIRNTTPSRIFIAAGQRVAQFLVLNVLQWLKVVEVLDLGETSRGTGGFGSTGK